MAKKFNKTITTAEQTSLYNKMKEIEKELATLRQEELNQFALYRKIEGKYSMGTVRDGFSGQGVYDFYYTYANKEDKEKEQAEMQAFYQLNILPIKTKIEELSSLYYELNEKLCIALWGFGTKKYESYNQLKRAEAELQKQIQYVDKLKKQLENS